VARISGIARRHASWRAAAGNEIAAAVAELREVVGDRPDLLAEVAGIQLGFHQGGLAEPRAKGAARLVIAAGADESLIPRWIEEGRRRLRSGAGLRSATRAVVHCGTRKRVAPAQPLDEQYLARGFGAIMPGDRLCRAGTSGFR
jgi:hypothetical protein